MKFLPVIRNVLLAPAAAALCPALFMLAPFEALGQSAKSTRAPHILRHDGKRFVAYVDEKSGTATWIIDTDSLEFNPGNAHSLSSKTSVSTAADAFIDAHVNVFGIDTKQLSEPRVETNGTFWFISYVQLYEGLSVLGSQVGVTITNSGRIVAAGARAFPKLDVQVDAEISKAAAIASARGQTTIPRTAAFVKESLVIVPEELADRYVFRLAWEVALENWDNAPPFSKTFLVDAHTGAVIAEYSNILDSSPHGQGPVRIALDEDARTDGTALSPSAIAAIPYALPRADIAEENIFGAEPPKPAPSEPAPSGTSTLSGTVTLNYYESPDNTSSPFVRNQNQPFPHAKVTVQNDATQQIYEVYADADGDYEVTGLANTTHTVTFEIANNKAYIVALASSECNECLNDQCPFCYLFRVDCESCIATKCKLCTPTCQMEKSFSVDIDGDTELNHNWGWGDGGDGGLTALALNSVYHVREMYDYFSDSNTYYYSGMNDATYKIWIYEGYEGTIDIYASSYPKRINLGGPNAMSHDIVYHEFTHDVIYTLHTPPNSMTSRPFGPEYNAMQEGVSDYFAADKTNHFAFAGPEEGNGDPVRIANSLGTSTVRLLYNSCTMDDFGIEEHTCGGNRGEIISGAIWRIRKDKTRPERPGAPASRLLFTALQMKPYAATFEALRDRYTAVAKNSDYINYGAYAATIEDRFAERRIGGPAIPGVPNITVDSQTRNPKITWRDDSLIEEGYRVEGKPYGGAWSVIADLAAGAEVYSDTSYQCISGQSGSKNTYSYRIVPYKNYTEGIGIVTSESATVTLSLNTCTITTAPALRIADASADVAMTDDVQLEEQKMPTGLEPPHPNPFNPVATIRYGLAEEGPARLTVYDVLGRRVAVLLDGVQTPGKHTVRFEADHLSSGLYFVILDAGGKTFTKSVLLMK